MPTADNTTEDTLVSEETTAEVVDTSTNEDSFDPTDDLSLDDVALEVTSLDEDGEEESDTDDSEAEELDTEPADTEEESEEDVEQSDEAESSDEEPEGETTPEDVKKHNAEMAARRIAEKQAREAAKLQSQQEFLESAEDDKDYALRQLQVEAYNNRVDRVTNTLESGIARAVNDIDLFRTGTPEVKEELVRRLDDFEAKYVRRSQTGDPIDVQGDVYEYLQNEADSIRRILDTGARSQVKAKSKAKARTDSLPTRAPKEPKVDPDLAAFDEELAKWD